MSILRNMFSDARLRPETCLTWLNPKVWNGLTTYWKSKEFKKRSVQAKKNRASDTGVGSSLHTGGSIPSAEHKRRLERELGEDVSNIQLFIRTHQKKADKTWVDLKSSQAYENFTTKLQELASTQNANDLNDHSQDVPEISEIDVWISQNVTKKGHIYGLGSEGIKYKGTSSYVKRVTSHIEVDDIPEFKNMKEQLAMVVQENEILERRVVELEKERSEKEKMARKIIVLEKKGKKVEQNVNKKLKLMMRVLKKSSKNQVSHFSPSLDFNDQS